VDLSQSNSNPLKDLELQSSKNQLKSPVLIYLCQGKKSFARDTLFLVPRQFVEIMLEPNYINNLIKKKKKATCFILNYAVISV
jgi:sRNA-binding regulator protein Hfq